MTLTCSVPSILRNNRFNRRDGNRTLDDDEEELWFEQDDDMADAEEIMPMADMLRSSDMLKSSKIDEFDAFSLKYENKKGTSCHVPTEPKWEILKGKDFESGLVTFQRFHKLFADPVRHWKEAGVL